MASDVKIVFGSMCCRIVSQWHRSSTSSSSTLYIYTYRDTRLHNEAFISASHANHQCNNDAIKKGLLNLEENFLHWNRDTRWVLGVCVCTTESWMMWCKIRRRTCSLRLPTTRQIDNKNCVIDVENFLWENVEEFSKGIHFDRTSSSSSFFFLLWIECVVYVLCIYCRSTSRSYVCTH